MPTFLIRPMQVSDLVAVREIYNHYVLTSTCTYQIEPETEDERLAWFRARSELHPGTVAEADGVVVGWAALSPWKARAGYARSVEASIYVRADHHRCGIGKALLLDLIERARAAGHHTILGGASSDQTASIALQENLGFVRVAHLREVGYKFDRWLDVVYMQLMLQ